MSVNSITCEDCKDGDEEIDPQFAWEYPEDMIKHYKRTNHNHFSFFIKGKEYVIELNSKEGYY